MLEGLKVLFITVLVALHLASPMHSVTGTNVQKPAVKAANTERNITTTIIPKITPITSHSANPISTNTSHTTQKKIYGAWYWQPQLGRAQMWVGTDAQGKDIFVDHIPTPTVSQQQQPPQLTTDAEKQACLEKVEGEFANQKPANCQTWTDQYDNQRTTCSEIYMPEFYHALINECGIHMRGY